MRFLGPHSAGEGPHLVPISLKIGSPSGPHFEKSGSPGLVGTVSEGYQGIISGLSLITDQWFIKGYPLWPHAMGTLWGPNFQ